MNNQEQNIENFKKNGYCTIKKSVSNDILDIITQYTLFDEIQNFNPEHKSGHKMVPNAHSVYADPAMESMLLYLQTTIEKNTGLTLYPTYSYYRIYRDGDELKPHKDRPACEISATLCFNYDYNNRNFLWPIYIQDSKIEQEPGDLTIYRGCKLFHHREKLNFGDDEIWHVQGFFHYVDANGPHADEKFDGRENIGYIERETPVTTLNRSSKKYIEYTK
jgi:hypothetical protein